METLQRHDQGWTKTDPLLWNTNFFFIILELGTLLNGFMGYFMTSMMEKVFRKKKKMNRRNGKAMEMNFKGYVR